VLHIGLNTGVGELAANKTLGVKDSVGGVHGGLRLGGISDKTLGLSESNIRRGGTVTLVVSDDLDTVVLPDTDTRVGGTKIDTDGFSSYSCTNRNRRRNKTLALVFVGRIQSLLCPASSVVSGARRFPSKSLADILLLPTSPKYPSASSFSTGC
jgi:hypothetical protein